MCTDCMRCKDATTIVYRTCRSCGSLLSCKLSHYSCTLHREMEHTNAWECPRRDWWSQLWVDPGVTPWEPPSRTPHKKCLASTGPVTGTLRTTNGDRCATPLDRLQFRIRQWEECSTQDMWLWEHMGVTMGTLEVCLEGWLNRKFKGR